MPPKRMTPEARKRWSPGSSSPGLALRDSSNANATPRQVFVKPTAALSVPSSSAPASTPTVNTMAVNTMADASPASISPASPQPPAAEVDVTPAKQVVSISWRPSAEETAAAIAAVRAAWSDDDDEADAVPSPTVNAMATLSFRCTAPPAEGACALYCTDVSVEATASATPAEPPLDPEQEPLQLLTMKLEPEPPVREEVIEFEAKLEQQPEAAAAATAAAEEAMSPASHSRNHPRWVMDDEHDGCMQCSVEFGLFTRRHHCRYCGVLCCGDCLAAGQIYSDRWVEEEDGRSVEKRSNGGSTQEAAAPLDLQAISVCKSCSKLAPGEIRTRADSAKELRASAAREQAVQDAAQLGSAELDAMMMSDLSEKAIKAGIASVRVGKAIECSNGDDSSPRRALVALVIEAQLLCSPLSGEEIRSMRTPSP